MECIFDIVFRLEDPWCSGLAHPPVTRKIVGSNPIGSAKQNPPFWGIFDDNDYFLGLNTILAPTAEMIANNAKQALTLKT